MVLGLLLDEREDLSHVDLIIPEGSSERKKERKTQAKNLDYESEYNFLMPGYIMIDTCPKFDLVPFVTFNICLWSIPSPTNKEI